MKGIAAFAFFVLTIVTTVSVRAEDGPIDGNLLKTVCAAPLDSAPGRFCAGYVAGYADGIRNGIAATMVGARFCFPKNVTVGDDVAAVQKYLADNSIDLTKSAGFLIGKAMYGTYGCK